MAIIGIWDYLELNQTIGLNREYSDLKTDFFPEIGIPDIIYLLAFPTGLLRAKH